jgi:hypothetical protein
MKGEKSLKCMLYIRNTAEDIRNVDITPNRREVYAKYRRYT